jgi:RNA polymerase sigma factor (TIGR02999 family)
LRKLAAQKMAQEAPGQTLQPTALVHEAYLRLVDVKKAQHWDSRGDFFAAAAEAMRRILVEQARRKGRERHGGGLKKVDLLAQEVAATPGNEQILILDAALTRLAGLRPQAAEIVNLRFFPGLTVEEAASVVGISPRTARRRGLAYDPSAGVQDDGPHQASRSIEHTEAVSHGIVLVETAHGIA